MPTVKVEHTTKVVQVYELTDDDYDHLENLIQECDTDTEVKDFLSTQTTVEHEDNDEDFVMGETELVDQPDASDPNPEEDGEEEDASSSTN